MRLEISDSALVDGKIPHGLLSKLYLISLNRQLKPLPRNPDSPDQYYLEYGTMKLVKLPQNLEDEITDLNLSNCSSLTSLPEKLPIRLSRLNLSNCDQLDCSPEILDKLSRAKDRGCTIIYPLHFHNQNLLTSKAKTHLEDCINTYKTINPAPSIPRPTFIKTLLHRYLTENMDERESAIELALNASQVIQLFKENPNHLKWAEEIAKVFLNNCINQPVAGWSEISAWVSIAQAPTILEKIAATKHLRALEGTANFIASLPEDQKPNQRFEVEAGNSLLRAVHKKLLDKKDIQKPWLAIPSSIAHVTPISRWLSKELIERAYLHTKSILEISNSDVAHYLCDGYHKETWGEVAFPESVAEIKNVYTKKLEFLERSMEPQTSNPLKPKRLVVRDENGLSESELIDLQVSLAKNREAEISTKVRELTFAALINAIPNTSSAAIVATPIHSSSATQKR